MTRRLAALLLGTALLALHSTARPAAAPTWNATSPQACAPSGFVAVKSGAERFSNGELQFCTTNLRGWAKAPPCEQWLNAEAHVKMATNRADAVYSGLAVTSSYSERFVLFYCLPKKAAALPH